MDLEHFEAFTSKEIHMKDVGQWMMKSDAKKYPLLFVNWNKVKQLAVVGRLGSISTGHMQMISEMERGCYLSKNQTEVLLFSCNDRDIRYVISRCGRNLRSLCIRNSVVRVLDITHLVNLLSLKLLDNLSFPQTVVIEGLDNLREIELESTPIKRIEISTPLLKVEVLSLVYMDLDDLGFIKYFPKLRTLSMCDLSIKKLPDSIRELNSLELFTLARLELDDLPNWMPEWGLPFGEGIDGISRLKVVIREGVTYFCGIILNDVKIKNVDMSIFSQPQEVILQWFEERKKANAGAPLNEVKVVFLGDGEAGKSHTIARLLNDGGEPVNFTGDSTPGIVITDKEYQIGERNVQVHFWDFGGQEILHSMHRMFLTNRTLYVILINARDDTQDDRARYWLHNVKSFANGAPVLLVLNKMDQNPNASVNESDLRALYPGLTEVVKLSAMFDDQEKFNASFTEAMKRQISSMENLSFFFPAAWTKAKQRLLGMTKPYIYGSDYAAICDECGVSGEGGLRMGLLNWFNDLGVSICYGGSRRLRDYVILRPNWITNAIYAILFNKHPETRDGIISHDAIFEMIQPPKEGDDPYRRTNSTESYSDVEIDYILNVTRKFRLSFRVDDDHEFIPMLCDRESKPIAADYAADPDALEFQMTFDYLPGNVLHRLMVELRQDLDTSQVWRTGAHFEQKSSGLSAVVKSEGNVLKIFVRGSGKSHKSNTYLCILKDTLDWIVKSMNLEPPVNEVVYKLEGKRQAFDYDELVESQEIGVTTRYSRVHKRRLFIDDILNQTCRSAEVEREQLLRDILAACGQLQANKRNWKSGDDKVREDDRNTYIRDLLRAKGYHVSDQTFSGSSATGKQAGEVDLMILRESDTPWTLIEALNISGKQDKQIKNWEEHLTKLLDHYNANGLPFLFLVSYVDISKDEYHSVINAYIEHLRFYSPDRYVLQSGEPVDTGDDPGHYIQTAQCVYDRGGFPTKVYHIFVRMGA